MMQEANPTSEPSLDDAKNHARTFLDKPYVTGGSFRSGCSQERLTQAIEHLPEDHPLRGALPKSDPKKTNTIRQIERTISAAFPDCITTLTSDRTSHLVHISSPMSNPGEINLSLHRIRVTLTFEGDRIKNVEMTDLSASGREILEPLEKAIYDAESVLNSTAWQLSYKHLHAAVKSLPLWTGSYLVQTEVGSWMVDQWSAVARECGQPVGRADRPAEVAHMSLEEQVQEAITRATHRATQKAQSATKKGIASEMSAVVDLLSQIKNLKGSLGIATNSLEAEAQKALALWTNVSQQAQAKAQAEERWALTERGQALLDKVRQENEEGYFLASMGNVLEKSLADQEIKSMTDEQRIAYKENLRQKMAQNILLVITSDNLKKILEACEGLPLKTEHDLHPVFTAGDFVKVL